MDVIDLCSSCSEDDDKCDTMPQEPPRTKKQRQATTSIEYPIRIDIEDDNVVQNTTTTTTATTTTTTTSTAVSTTGNSNNNQVKVDATLYPSKDRFFNPYLCRTNRKDTTKTPTSTTVNTIGQNHITTAITSSSSSSSSSYNHINTNTAIFPHNNDTAIATPGIIPLILNYITISNNLNDKTNNTSTTTTLILSSSTSTTSMLHIQQKDKWSCGYRNLQMLLSVVLPVVPNTNRTLSPLLLPVLPVHPLNQRLPPPQQQEPQQQQRYCVPSLHDIQVSLEELWSNGYDQKGAEHYHYRIQNQSKWIGAVEVANYLSYQYHIDTTIIEFILCPESRSLLIPFCIYYFTKQSSKQHLPTCPYNSYSDDNHLHINNNTPTNSITTLNMVCDILQSIEKRATTHHNQLDDIVIPTCTCPTTVPLYLQWNGHSVTIIGIELSTQQLIILDPKCHGSNLRMTLLQQQQQQQPHKPSRPLPSMLRLSMSNLIHKDCQVVVIAAATTTTTPSSTTTTTYPPPLSQYQLEHIRNNNVPSIIAASDVVMNVRRQQQR